MSERYFQKQEIKNWSLVDFDSWSVQNSDHCQLTGTHKKFYSYLNSILLDENTSEEKINRARALIKTKNVSNFKPTHLTVSESKLRNSQHQVPN